MAKQEFVDPVLLLSEDKLIKLIDSSKNITFVDFNNGYGDIIQQKVLSLEAGVMIFSIMICRRTKLREPDFLIASSEIATILCKNLMLGVIPDSKHANGITKIKPGFGKWEFYCTCWLPHNFMMFGYKENGRIKEEKEFLGRIQVANFIL